MDIKVKRLTEKAVIPVYQKPGDAGLDLTCTSVSIKEGKIIYGTDLAIEIPEGYVGLIFPRSSIHKFQLSLANSVGVIDSGYRGEIKVIFRLTDPVLSGKLYEMGDRIAQLVILPYPTINLVDTAELSDTVRGGTGFGSSGQKTP